MSVTFQQAYEAATRRFSPRAWLLLDQRQQIAAIYRAMRQLDGNATNEAGAAAEASVVDAADGSGHPVPAAFPAQQDEQ